MWSWALSRGGWSAAISRRPRITTLDTLPVGAALPQSIEECEARRLTSTLGAPAVDSLRLPKTPSVVARYVIGGSGLRKRGWFTCRLRIAGTWRFCLAILPAENGQIAMDRGVG